MKTGKFVHNNSEAYLAYTADLESGIFLIESMDEAGYEFLHSIFIDNKITLLKADAELGLLVTNLTVTDPLHIQCQAVVVDP